MSFAVAASMNTVDASEPSAVDAMYDSSAAELRGSSLLSDTALVMFSSFLCSFIARAAPRTSE